MDLNFRTLRPGEIDCRVSQINEKGLTLLLYKDARCDMNLLDETVGPMNWMRCHSRENANCTVSIYDGERGIWISKEDTGTESNTEAQKGLASDSFKRACVNWGIGRELYTAPFIYIKAGNYETRQAKNGKLGCKTSFAVKDIQYNDLREITALAIIRTDTGVIVYQKGYEKPEKPREAKPEKLICSICGNEITGCTTEKGEYSPADIARKSAKKYGKPVCLSCGEKMNGN